MSFLDYNPNIPGSQNNPSDDQPKMRTNTNSIRDWVLIDHFGFKDPNSYGGLHKQTRIINQLNIPAGLNAQMGTIYTKLATSTGVLTESNIFFTPGTTGNEYQLTRPITASFALFGNLTANYNLAGANFFGGWTFLPGGLLYQYGRVDLAPVHAEATVVPFPVTFSDVSTIVTSVTSIANNSSISQGGSQATTVTATSFRAVVSTSAGVLGFYWTAIGK